MAIKEWTGERHLFKVMTGCHIPSKSLKLIKDKVLVEVLLPLSLKIIKDKVLV